MEPHMLKDALTTLFIEKGDVLQLSETEVPVLFTVRKKM